MRMLDRSVSWSAGLDIRTTPEAYDAATERQLAEAESDHERAVIRTTALIWRKALTK